MPTRVIWWALALPFAVACGPEAELPTDLDPPSSSGRIILPSGAVMPLEPGITLLNTIEATVALESDEPGFILYTLDRSDPVQGAPNTATGGSQTSFNLVRDAVIRWKSLDKAGNAEAVHEAEIRFDRAGPQVQVGPEAGAFEGPVTVNVTTSEPATIYWTLDGTTPSVGGRVTAFMVAPAAIRIAESRTLRLVAIDEAGNRTEPPQMRYLIDTTPPRTRAVPPAGHYLTQIRVELVSDDPAAVVRYTIDGSEPDAGSPVWGAARPVDADAVLRFFAIDRGGNVEPVQEARYRIGSVGEKVATPAEDPYVFPTAGGTQLAAALIGAAGPLSGRGDPAGFGRDWSAWAVGRVVTEAYALQSANGIHAVYSARIAALAADAGAPTDTDGNGTNLDETHAARLLALAEVVGVDVPAGLFPTFAFYIGGGLRLLRPMSTRLRADGLPTWLDDFGQMRWEGTTAGQRALSVDSAAGALAALAARARAGTAIDHAASRGPYGRDVAPVVGLRCAGCHRPGGASPPLHTAAALRTARLVDAADPDQSSLLARLRGDIRHDGDPATPEQIAAVRAWIAAGAEDDDDAGPRRVGLDGGEGFAALLALDQATWALEHLQTVRGYDPETGTTGALGEDAARYVPALLKVTEGPAAPGLPRQPDPMRVDDPTFETGAQARLLEAALDIYGLAQDRPALFSATPLAGTPDRPDAPTLAGALAQSQVVRLLERTWDDDLSAFRASEHPRTALAGVVDAIAAADAAVALYRFAEEGPRGGVAVGGIAGRGVDFLRIRLVDENGLYHPTWDVAAEAPRPAEEGRPRLDVQLAVLRALVAKVVADGDVDTRRAARDLWNRLDTGWWDAGAGAWQTSWGEDIAIYPPDLAARAIRTLQDGVAAGILPPEANERLATFFDRVIQSPLRPSETWLCGELGTSEDADADGVPKPWAVGVSNGIAPAFLRAVEIR